MSEAPEHDETVHRLAEPADPVLVQWARFRPLFENAMREGFWTLEDLEQKIAHKRAYFFPGKEAAIVTEVVTYPGGERAMQAIWACGDPDEIVQLAPGVEAVARMMGCTTMLVEGRAAWAKVLKPLGYVNFSVTVRKAL